MKVKNFSKASQKIMKKIKKTRTHIFSLCRFLYKEEKINSRNGKKKKSFSKQDLCHVRTNIRNEK